MASSSSSSSSFTSASALKEVVAAVVAGEAAKVAQLVDSNKESLSPNSLDG